MSKPDDSNAEKVALEAEIVSEFPPGAADAGARPGPGPGLGGEGGVRGPSAPPSDDRRKAYEAMVAQLLEQIDQELDKIGLSKIGPAQKMLITLGAVGTCLKYNVDLDNYPELALGGGLVWAGYEKYVEFQKIRRGPGAAPGPVPGEPAPAPASA